MEAAEAPEAGKIICSSTSRLQRSDYGRRDHKVTRAPSEILDEPLDSRATDEDRTVYKPRGHSRLHSRLGQRGSERATGLTKSWANLGPELLFHNLFCTAKESHRYAEEECWEQIAIARSFRVPVILLQLYIRRAILRDRRDLRHLLALLPKGDQLRHINRILAQQGFTRDDLLRLTWVLEGQDDNARCGRFLELEIPKPSFLLRYLIRTKSHITDAVLLNKLIGYTHITYIDHVYEANADELPDRELRRWRRANEGMSTTLFSSTLELFALKCVEVEPRLIIKVADLAIQYIRNMERRKQHPDQIFHDRCFVFNEAMASIGRDQKRRPPRFFRSLDYVWHALKSLLSESAALSRPLQMNRKSFLAVRETLAGMPKTQSERHNSVRHSETWPPYLKAGDGIDEMVVPDENWTRAVQAGVLQQEAGYAKNERDEVLDTLQGKAPDGTPTIQQRLAKMPRSIGLWEASIRATRNAEEAWGRFQNPPRPDMRPGLYEYAAMFKKLSQKTVWEDDDGPMIRPGDRDLSFPTKDINLSDFAKATLRPPTVDELYTQMMHEGIRPTSTCLEVLVASADQMEDANKYLDDSGEDYTALTNALEYDDSRRAEILKPPMSLLSSYIHCLCSTKVSPWHALPRAIAISTARFSHDPDGVAWAPLVWGHIFRAMSDPSPKYGTVAGHLNLLMRVLDQLEPSAIGLPEFLQFCKGIRGAIVGRVDDLVFHMESRQRTSLTTLYVESKYLRTRHGQSGHLELKTRGDEFQNVWSRLKGLVEMIVSREQATRDLLGYHGADALDQMAARRDPVKARDAFDAMVCFAFMGEFELMARFLTWLTEQWGTADVQGRLGQEVQMPRMANFTELLCAFRLFAEPMLDEKRVAELQDLVDKVGHGWEWPMDEDVYLFRDIYPSASFHKLSHALEWARHWKTLAAAEQDGQDVCRVSIEPPKSWKAVEAMKAHEAAHSLVEPLGRDFTSDKGIYM